MNCVYLVMGLLACGFGSPPSDTEVPEDTDPSGVVACAGGASTPILLASGAPSGFERCDDGTVHRVSAQVTDPAHSRPACDGTESLPLCAADAECTDGPNGRCEQLVLEFDPTCRCVYSCASDADCGADEACMPVEAAGALWPRAEANARCIPAMCRADADCASGVCGLGRYAGGCQVDYTLSCRSEADECRLDSECPYGACAAVAPSEPPFTAWGAWACTFAEGDCE